MPHIIVEHTKEINVSNLLPKIHNIVIASGLFDPAAIKTRNLAYDNILWGAQAEQSDFIHISVKILTGRTLEKRANLSSEIFKIMQATHPEIALLSVDIIEMVAETYSK
jgi:5-carboxymethyl-2-hydroxymuconate isomerase